MSDLPDTTKTDLAELIVPAIEQMSSSVGMCISNKSVLSEIILTLVTFDWPELKQSTAAHLTELRQRFCSQAMTHLATVHSDMWQPGLAEYLEIETECIFKIMQFEVDIADEFVTIILTSAVYEVRLQGLKHLSLLTKEHTKENITLLDSYNIFSTLASMVMLHETHPECLELVSIQSTIPQLHTILTH